jgi:hypothetical protein
MGKLLLFMTLIICPPPIYGAGSYTLADLESLGAEGSYQEYLDHALDIRPSERQDSWKAMTSKMAHLYTKSLLQQGEIKEADFRQINKLFTWPTLKSDDLFRARRSEIGLSFLKKCLKSETPCWDEVKLFWEADKNDPETSYKLAELAASYPTSPLPTWNFLEISLKSNLSEFYCKKDFVMKTLWKKFEVDYIRIGKKGDLLKKIDETVHPDCLPSLTAVAQKKLRSPDSPRDRELAFQLLDAQMKAPEDIKDFFYTVYLVENPSQGELFNLSWNRIKELGSLPHRRETVLKEIKQLDPLPDAIIASMDETKKRVILNHLKRYFPEYLEFYTNRCLDYYSGEIAFPQGNPTMNCSELMKSEIAPSLLDRNKIQRFEKIRNI